MSFLELLFGSDNEKALKKLKPIVEKVNALEKSISEMSDEELKKQTTKFKEEEKRGFDLIPEAFATVREVSKRVLDQRHFDVQIMGGVSLYEGKIAEMRTGEGKTLVATLPSYLHSIEGKKVHIVTVNDYLARRDAVLMGQIYAFLGLTVAVINSENKTYKYSPGHKEVDEERDTLGGYKIVYEFLEPCSRKEAYEADIVYGTNNEFAFDYLRDNIEYNVDNLRQKSLDYAIIDEVDSVLIDEARNPLIISGPANIPTEYYKQFSQLVASFEKGVDYEVIEKDRAIQLTKDGINKAEKALKVDNLYIEGAQRTLHYIENAVKAKSLFKKDQHYVIQNNKIVIVDEFTGRLQPGKQWSNGLHQAIEAKENLPINQENRSLASITFQNYFRKYKNLSGMTGTARTSSEEFFKVYKMPVISIPTNLPVKREDNIDAIYQTKRGKLNAIVSKVKELNEKGQPVLIGTPSIESNEELSKLFKKKNIKHEVLNAKNHEQEGAIIAQAGRKNGVTVATNLAGRGIDIKLGGTPAKDEEYKEVKEKGGLFVIGTERNEARRIDDQLRGRSGRQGDEGETQFFISLEDPLVKVFGTERIKNISTKLGLPEDQEIRSKIITNSIESAQKRIEGHNFDSRRFALQYDSVLGTHRDTVYEKRREILLSKGDRMKRIIDSYLRLCDEGTIKEKKDTLGDKFEERVKVLILHSMDTLWIEHLELMDLARGSTGLRSYGQKEPLMEYKREGMRIFRDFFDRVNEYFTSSFPKLKTD